MYIVLSLILAYLLGSLPYGLILVKIFKKVDIRTIGSKNIGFTNVFRCGYKKLAFVTLFFDVFKGLIAVVLTLLITKSTNVAAIAAIIATAAHIYPIWLQFKGGKGVASGFGAIFILNPMVGAIALIIWLAVFYFTKYSSLSAILATLFILVCGIAFISKSSIAMSLALIVIPLLVLYKHKPNIIRILNGTEDKLIK